jgi:hypothetical protein
LIPDLSTPEPSMALSDTFNVVFVGAGNVMFGIVPCLVPL